MQIESYRSRIEEFTQGLNRELYLSRSGKKSRLELVRLYSDYSDLFRTENIRELESALKTESFESRRKSLEKIQLFLTDQYLDYRTAPVSEEIAGFDVSHALVWEGQEIPVSQVPTLLRREPDALRRRKLYERQAKALGEFEELKRSKVAQLRAASIDLGFRNYVDAKERVTGIQYEKLLSAFDEGLGRLEDKYVERFRASLEMTLGIPFHEIGSWDAAHWEAKNDQPHAFRENNLRGMVDLTIAELGVRPGDPEAVCLELERRTGKQSSPVCIPIRIPQEIKICMVPGDGSRYYAALLHECGHAYHFAWTSPSLPAEHRILGDRGLCESYAFLFEHFVQEREWLSRIVGFSKSESFIRFQALFRIFLIRRCAGKLCFSIKLHEQGSLDDAPQIYAETMRRYTGLQYAPESWKSGSEDDFISADHLRGWTLEAMLREYLRTKYGNAWALNRSASRFLKEIWETGMLYRADDLCREIGSGALEPQVLADQLWEGLQR
jgi:hypothetical protein